jgi:release factor glutamine methyltransferase
LGILDIIHDTAQKLSARYQHEETCIQYAWWMLTAITGKRKEELLVAPSTFLTPSHLEQLETWIYRQCHEHMPLQYLLGTVPFLDLDLFVEPPILIPRPETEEWVAHLCTTLQGLNDKKLRIIDIGTGTGCIALALAHALPESEVIALDINPQALKLARKNAAHNKITNIIFIQSDLFEHVHDSADLIVSNPPYISEDELSSLDASVVLWEDLQALQASDHGLGIIKKIIEQAPDYLSPHKKELLAKGIPQLIIEIGYRQGPRVLDLMQQAGYSNVRIYRDLAGHDRAVQGMRKLVRHN